MSQKFEVTIEYAVNVDSDAWPSREERQSETLGGNRDYFELHSISWNEVKELIDIERTTIHEIDASSDSDSAFETWVEEQYEDGGFGVGMDLGVNSLVAALRASHCLPFYSCNGGAFGDGHNDSHPVVVFFWRKKVASLILRAAMKCHVGLMHNRSGGVTAYASNVDALINMAEFLHFHRKEIMALNQRQPRTTRPPDGQQNLF